MTHVGESGFVMATDTVGVNDAGPALLGSDVSIATAAYGNAAVTQLCLQAILESARGDFELILVDDCSPDDGAVRRLFAETRRRHANTKVFCFTENLEYSGSLNSILSHASGKWILFVSNDIFVTPFYLRELLAAAQRHPRTGILRGSSNFVDNGLASHNLPPTRPVQNLQDVFAVGAEMLAKYPDVLEPDPFLVGDAFLVQRAVLDRIGTLDPCFYGYFADSDFGLRARIAGFDTVVVRGAYAWHQRAANFSYLPQQQRAAKLSKRWERVFENWARFKMKYGFPVAMPYRDVRAIPWASLQQTEFDPNRHFCPPGDYRKYLLPDGPVAS